jgi:hypothetical protein
VDPVPDPILLRKSSSAGYRTQTSGSLARNSHHYTIEAVVPDPLLLRKSGSAWNRTRTSGSGARNSEKLEYTGLYLPVVLYRCETWARKLREHRLRVFENRVLMRIFELKRDEVEGGW